MAHFPPEPAPGNHRLPAAVASKILTRDTLAQVRARLAAEGRRLVQCHGCFDIVHPGHIRHLRQARSLGDCLLVSITTDSGVGKGAGRPLIPEELRAENLASLDCVDFVFVSPHPTAVQLLSDTRPDIYVKGKEYETNNDPRFKAEREVVEAAGGRVVFSSGDVVFSSSALIAAMERSVDPFQQRLGQLSQDPRLTGPSLYATIAAMRGRRVVVIGEPIIDTYILCDRPDVAGESPMMTLRPLEARHYDGGAAVIARHAAALGAHPVLVTALPESEDGRAFARRLESEGVEVRSIQSPRPVPEKQRFLVGSQKLMKLDLLDRFVLDQTQQDRFLALAMQTAASEGGCDAAIVADFGLGLFSPQLLARTCTQIRPHARVMSGDVSGKRSSLRAMRNLDLLCPSESELRDAMQLHEESLPLVTWRLLEETRAKAALVTMGADGLIAFDRLPQTNASASEDGSYAPRLSSEHIPAMCPIAMDPLGCGDTLLAAATLALAAEAPLITAAFLGACAASVQVQRLGNTAITAADLRQMIARVHSAHLTWSPEAIEARRAPAMARAS